MSDLKKSILLVEDNLEISQSLIEVLASKEYHVVHCSDGRKALETIRKANLFDLVLLDIMLPDVNGWQVLLTLKSSSKTESWPVIMLTSLSDDTFEERALYEGADDYITKPFRIKPLLARIETTIKRASKYSFGSSAARENNIIKDLSPREKDVLTCLAMGLNNAEMAEKLGISKLTVDAHLRRLFLKLNVENRTKAAIIGIQCGILDSE